MMGKNGAEIMDPYGCNIQVKNHFLTLRVGLG